MSATGTATAKKSGQPNKVTKKASVKVAQPPAAPAAGMKHCNRCGKDFPATLEFWASNKAAKDGMYYIDKQCEREIRNARKQVTAPAATASAEPNNVVALPAAATVRPKAKKGSKK